MSRTLALLVALVVLCFGMTTSAQEVRIKLIQPVRLDYHAPPGCPDEALARVLVASRLGTDPFLAPSTEPVPAHRVVIRLRHERGGASGLVDFYDRAGALVWSRDRLYARTCFEVVTIFTTITVPALLEELETVPTSTSPPGPACAAAAPTSTPPPPGPACADSRTSIWPTEWPLSPLEKPRHDSPEPQRSTLALRVGSTVWAEMIAAGWGSFGLTAEVGVRYRAVSLGVEAHGDPPLGSTPVKGIGAVGSVTFARLSGALLACTHWGWFTGCAVGDVGRFFFPNHIQDIPASASYSAVGVRASLDFPVARLLSLHAAIDLRAPIDPLRFSSKGNEVFASAGFGGGFGLGVFFELPR